MNGKFQVIPKIDMGPFESVEVISEIQILNGRWIPSLGQVDNVKKNRLLIGLFIFIILIGIGILFRIRSVRMPGKTNQ